MINSYLRSILPPILACLGVEALQRGIEKTFPPLRVENYDGITTSKSTKLRHTARLKYDTKVSWLTRGTLYDMVWRPLPLGLAFAAACYMTLRQTGASLGSRVVQTALAGCTATRVMPIIRRILYKILCKIGRMNSTMERSGVFELARSRFLSDSRVIIENENEKGKDFVFHPEQTREDSFWDVSTKPGLAYHLLTATAAVGPALLLLKKAQHLFLSKYPSINAK